jgi:hypothetical protein
MWRCTDTRNSADTCRILRVQNWKIYSYLLSPTRYYVLAFGSWEQKPTRAPRPRLEDSFDSLLRLSALVKDRLSYVVKEGLRAGQITEYVLGTRFQVVG